MEETKEQMPASEREWSKGLANEVVFLVDNLKNSGRLGTIVDCGAGEGRHSIYSANEGASKVITIEKDPEQVAILRKRKEENNLSNLEVIEGDILERLAILENESVDGIIDCGLSHCLTEDDQREQFVNLVYSKLKPGGLYSITHFSEKETLSQNYYRTDLAGLKELFPGEKWTEVMPWQEASWKREDSQEHHAYKAVLKRV